MLGDEAPKFDQFLQLYGKVRDQHCHWSLTQWYIVVTTMYIDFEGYHQRLWAEPERKQRVTRNGRLLGSKHIGISKSFQPSQEKWNQCEMAIKSFEPSLEKYVGNQVISALQRKVVCVKTGPQLSTECMGWVRREQACASQQVRPGKSWHEQGEGGYITYAVLQENGSLPFLGESVYQ